MATTIFTAGAVRVPHTPPTPANLNAYPSIKIILEGAAVHLYGVKSTLYAAAKKRNAALQWCHTNKTPVMEHLMLGKTTGICMVSVDAESVLTQLAPEHVRALFTRRGDKADNNVLIQRAFSRAKFFLDYIKFDKTSKQYRWVTTDTPYLWVVRYGSVAFVEPPDAIRVIKTNDVGKMAAVNSVRARVEMLLVANPTPNFSNLRKVILAGETRLAATPADPVAPRVEAPPPRPTTGGKSSIVAAFRGTTVPVIDFLLDSPEVDDVDEVVPPPPPADAAMSDSDSSASDEESSSDEVAPPPPVDAAMNDSDSSASDEESSSDEDDEFLDSQEVTEEPVQPLPVQQSRPVVEPQPVPVPVADPESESEADDGEVQNESCEDDEDMSQSSGSGSDGDQYASCDESGDEDAVPTAIEPEEPIEGVSHAANALTKAYISKMYNAGRHGPTAANAYLSEDARVAHELRCSATALSQSILETDTMIASAMRTIQMLKRKREVLIELRNEAMTQIMLAERIAGRPVDPQFAQAYHEAKKLRLREPATKQAVFCALGQ